MLVGLWSAAHLAERVVARELAARGVDDEQLALLLLLADAPEPRTPTALARELGVPFTTLVHALGRLVARGEAERLQHPTDGRSQVARLTPAGEQRAQAATAGLEAAATAVAAELGRSPGEIGDEMERLRNGLRRAADL